MSLPLRSGEHRSFRHRAGRRTAVGRPRAPTEQPQGLVYRPDFVSPDEEAPILAFLDALEFRAVEMRGQAAKRTVRHFGLNYDYESWRVTPGEPLPTELEWLRDRAAGLAGAAPPDLAETLVSRYPPG